MPENPKEELRRLNPKVAELFDSIYGKKIAVQPTNPCPFLGRAVARRARHEDDLALQDLRRAEELAPKWATPRTERGVLLAVQGDLVGAIDAFTCALSLRPDSPEALHHLSAAHMELQEPDAAERHLNALLARHPGDANAIARRGCARCALDRCPEALDDFERAIRIDPAKSVHHVGRALVLLGRGDAEEAENALGRALELDPRNPLIHALRYRLRDARGDVDAIADHDKAIKLMPEIFQRADPSRLLMTPPSALYFARFGPSDRLFAPVPMSPEDCLAWGRQRAVSKRWREAAAHLSSAVELMADPVEALTERGWALHLEGRDQEALADLDRALSLTPSPSLAIKRLAVMGAPQA